MSAFAAAKNEDVPRFLDEELVFKISISFVKKNIFLVVNLTVVNLKSQG